MLSPNKTVYALCNRKAFFFLLLTGNTSLLYADINDYFVRRLVLYESDCRLDTLAREKTNNQQARFFVTCQNISFYPDGIDITCSNEDDETSCEIKTNSRKFNSLDVLYRDRNKRSE